MKIELNTELKEYLDTIFDHHFKNIEASNLIDELLDASFDNISDVDIMMLSSSLSISKEEALYQAMIKLCDIDPEDEELKTLEDYNCINKTIIYNNEYDDNEYFKSIKKLNKKEGRWHIFNDYYSPYTPFITSEITSSKEDFYSEKVTIGAFKKRFDYLKCLEGETCWMSITPHEINTMEDVIKEAEGNVIACGLGLGYFPFMCSLKDEVKHITIIEKDEKIIDLFSKCILPFFKHKEKISIVKDDAYSFLERLPNEKAFLFFDIYHTPEDGLLPYIKVKKILTNKDKITKRYWIEKTLLTLLKRIIITLLYENIYVKNASYSNAQNDEEKILSALNSYLENTIIKSINDVDFLLDDDNLKNLIIKLNID